MIVVDASAILAILLSEDDRSRFVERLKDAGELVMSPVNFWEVLVRTHAIDGAEGMSRAERVIFDFGVQIVPVDTETARLAARAFAQFGKRTPAGLNMGDCFAYALAKQRNAPLLFKGDDFTKTDVAVA